MNTSKLKTYAPAARKEFMRAVTERAAYLGLSKDQIEPAEVKGEIALIGDRAFPKGIVPQRERLEKRITEEGFDVVMESVAYTWFNRMLALRYMELHGYLDNGFRVLSHPNGGHIPELLEQAAHVELSGLNHDQVVEMKLDGTKDAELYRMLFIAQCNALHQAMPFLFEAIQDETELLLPDNLLHTNSLLQKLVKEIPEEDWQEVEIIGWIYQFYISEKKDEVFEGLKKNKKITPENIPAATQLFTPNWIVRYLVENSLGRLWMLNRPKSCLIEQMDYYIKPEQEETDFLHISKPEELKICDPACGSGHMLVYSFDLLYAIYEEEGYAPAEIPEKILTHNLYGIEIDERAGELAALALTMKARAKQRRFFGKPVQPNICVLKKIQFDEGDLKNYMDFVGRDLFTAPLQTTLCQFEEADNFGSLIRPEVTDVEGMLKILEEKNVSENLFLNRTHQKVLQALRQAHYLSPKYHVVIANPPYMGSKGMNGRLGAWLKDNYTDVKSDLFSAFIERNLDLTQKLGSVAMITMQSWMFLSSFEKLRNRLLGKDTIRSMAHLGARAFDSIGGEVVSTTAFVLENSNHPDYKGSYLRLIDGNSEAEKKTAIREAIKNPDCGWFYHASTADFRKIPGSPISYWVSGKVYGSFEGRLVENYLDVLAGLTTGNTDKFLRYWQEVNWNSISFVTNDIPEDICYVPYDKGGSYRKWYGNLEYVLSYSKKSLSEMEKQKGFRPDGISMFFKESLTWAKVATSDFSTRFSSDQNAFDATSSSAFGKRIDLAKAALILNSRLGTFFLNILNSTMVYLPRDVKNMPIVESLWESDFEFNESFNNLFHASKSDWDAFETSWDFVGLPLLQSDFHQPSLNETYTKLRSHWHDMTLEMQRLEQENNRIFIKAYGLQEELNPEVPMKEITLTCNPQYRYGGNKSEDELEELLLADTIKELLSYALSCMMGRYSLDQPGLVYAHSGNEGFDPSKYSTFPADDDGIVPITDLDWFPDDVTNRFVEFIKVAWPPETLEENLRFIANNLSPKKGEIPREIIRRYFSTAFFKDHLKTYKKRPIYWLFSSGKERTFQCLVYLHRYNESTLSRMRNEYVIPLQGKLASRTEHLDQEAQSATSTSQQNKIRKQLEAVKKKQQELIKFDEELRHYADKRIYLDLDDGVKVNYQKFGNLLAEI